MVRILILSLVVVSSLWLGCWAFSTPIGRVGMMHPPLQATVDTSQSFRQQKEDIEQSECVICGSGPAGLLTAIMMAQKKPTQTIQVFDRLAPPPLPDDDEIWSDVAKFYLIGLGGRGQTALREFDVWEDVLERCVTVRGRKDWQPGAEEGIERIFTKKEKKVPTQVLPRDKLVGVLHKHILEKYADRIELNYGYEVSPIEFDYRSQVLLQVAKCSDDIALLNLSAVRTTIEDPQDILCLADTEVRYIAADFVVAADGTARTFPNVLEEKDVQRFTALNPLQKLTAPKPFRVQRYPNDNERVYKTIPMKIPKDWRPDLNYSARTNRINFDALPADKNGNYCGVLLLKRNDPLAQPDTDPVDLRTFLDESLPQFSVLLDDDTVAAVAKKPVSYLPGFRYASPRLHQNNCVLLGDAIHTVKPYFGLGANSALADVQILGDIIDSGVENVPEVFSEQRAGEARALVRISRDLDRPGCIGFLTFILPLILDSIFSGLMPKVFTPNIIAMLQRDDYTFQQVARRKMAERVGQIMIIGSGLTGTVFVARWILRSIVRALGKSTPTVVASAMGAMTVVALLRKFLQSFGLESTPGEVLAKVSKAMPDGKSQESRFANRQGFMIPFMAKLWKRRGEEGASAERGSSDSRFANGESFLTPLTRFWK